VKRRTGWIAGWPSLFCGVASVGWIHQVLWNGPGNSPDGRAILPDRTGVSATSWKFAVFVLAHERCEGDVVEARTDENSTACWCPA